jgi:hypothetical protein
MRQPLPEDDEDDDDDDDDDDDECHVKFSLSSLTLEQLQTICRDYMIEAIPAGGPKEASAAASLSSDDEKEALRQAIRSAQETMATQINPHQLQPPFDDVQIHGDLLLLRVAKTDEVLDRSDDDDEEKEDKDLAVLLNQEFFLDYTKDEYIAFASRTDVVAPEQPEHGESEEDDEDDSEDEEAYELGEDDDVEDDDEGGLLNLLMNEVLKKFRQDNGRGPTSEEVLELRSAVAQKLGVQVPSVPQKDDSEEEGDKKRAAEPSDGSTSAKKVKFSSPGDDAAEGGTDDEFKPAAEENCISKDDAA